MYSIVAFFDCESLMWLIVCFFSQWWWASSVSLWRCLGSKSACRNGPDVFRHNFQFGTGGWLKTDPRGSLASCTRWCKNIRTYPRSLVCFVHISYMWTDVNFRMAKGFYVKSARLAAVSFGPSPAPNSVPLFCDGRQIWCQVPNSAVLKNVIDNDKTDCSIRGNLSHASQRHLDTLYMITAFVQACRELGNEISHLAW